MTVVDAHGDFDTFYLQEHPQQVKRATLLLGSDELANDLVHDAFIRVYQRWGQLENPGGYLSRSVLNACRDEGRSRTVRLRVLGRLAEPAATTEPNDHLVDALMALPFNQRAAIVLRFYARMTVPEIAEHLGVPTGSIGPWIGRGLTKLRKALA